MVEVPCRFLAAGSDQENGGRQQVGGLEGLYALASDAVSELLQSIELGALRKAASIVNILHVVPALKNPGHCGLAALREILPASGRAANNFFCATGKGDRRRGRRH